MAKAEVTRIAGFFPLASLTAASSFDRSLTKGAGTGKRGPREERKQPT